LSGGEGREEVRTARREVVGAREGATAMAAEDESAWALEGGCCWEEGGRLLMARAEAVLGSPGYGE
jgi:hypothetical protein